MSWSLTFLVVKVDAAVSLEMLAQEVLEGPVVIKRCLIVEEMELVGLPVRRATLVFRGSRVVRGERERISPDP